MNPPKNSLIHNINRLFECESLQRVTVGKKVIKMGSRNIRETSEKASVCFAPATTSEATMLLRVFISEMISVCRLQISEEEL